MIYWLDEPIVHSVLSGLLLLGFSGVLWSIYVRLWQLVLWEVWESAINDSIDKGFHIKKMGFKIEIEASHPSGQCIIWKGGLNGEHSTMDIDQSALLLSPKK